MQWHAAESALAAARASAEPQDVQRQQQWAAALRTALLWALLTWQLLSAAMWWRSGRPADAASAAPAAAAVAARQDAAAGVAPNIEVNLAASPPPVAGAAMVRYAKLRLRLLA